MAKLVRTKRALTTSLIKPFTLTVMGSLLLSACATSSLFSPYPEQASNYRSALHTATGLLPTSVEKDLLKKANGKDGLLYWQELGRLYQLAGQTEDSLKAFEKVYQAYQKQDDRAVLSTSELGSNSLALMSNDNAIPYVGYPYERILATHFQAFNYLSQGDIEGATVELRRAALEQRILEEKHAREIERAESSARNNDIDTSLWKNNPELAGLDAMAGKVKSAFQNPYTYYTSAVIWESLGDINAANIDYKKALEINPDNQTILQDIKRLNSLDARQAVQDKGDVIILFEDGFIPSRQSVNISLPYFASREYVTYFSVAIPFYSSQPMPNSLVVSEHGKTLGHTQTIANFGAMAAKALKDQLPPTIIRMILRARTKHEIHQQSAKEAGVIGSLFATLYNVISEQADLRSWLTLPNNAQIFRTQLTFGTHQLELALPGQRQSITVETKPGHKNLIRVINLHNRMIIQSFTL